MPVTVRARQTSVAFAVGWQQTLLKGEPLEVHVYNRVRPAALGDCRQWSIHLSSLLGPLWCVLLRGEEESFTKLLAYLASVAPPLTL